MCCRKGRTGGGCDGNMGIDGKGHVCVDGGENYGKLIFLLKKRFLMCCNLFMFELF